MNKKEKHDKCPSCSREAKKWYQERIFIVLLVIIILIPLGFLIPLLHPFSFAFVDYLRMIWWAILIGFLIGGIIDYFIPQSYIEKYLSRHRKRIILY
ncbi:MAG TPA: hypothetical protein ENI49_05970, partial [Thermoplasmatales archaeon]|nr:hypothetical protein [Thermoplasmatales archaeon]